MLVPSLYLVKEPKVLRHVLSQFGQSCGSTKLVRSNPCPHPISLDRAHFGIIQQGDYTVTEKADGVRYQLLLGRFPRSLNMSQSEYSVMIDRRLRVFQVQVMAEDKFYNGSLFDGELVLEHEEGFQEPRQVYLVFDAVRVCGELVIRDPFLKRYELVHKVFDLFDKDIIRGPRQWAKDARELAADHKLVSMGNESCLTFRPKRFMALNELPALLRHRAKLLHKSDGLIFQRSQAEVQWGTDTTAFKWKEVHTLDFQVDGKFVATDAPGNVEGWETTLWVREEEILLDVGRAGVICPSPSGHESRRVAIALIPNEFFLRMLQTFRDSFSVIVECECRLPNEAEWETGAVVECIPLKVRTDKAQPNNMSVATRTLVNIRENVTSEELLSMV